MSSPIDPTIKAPLDVETAEGASSVPACSSSGIDSDVDERLADDGPEWRRRGSSSELFVADIEQVEDECGIADTKRL